MLDKICQHQEALGTQMLRDRGKLPRPQNLHSRLPTTTLAAGGLSSQGRQPAMRGGSGDTHIDHKKSRQTRRGAVPLQGA